MKISTLIILLLLSLNALSQVPGWTWEKNAQGISYDGAESVATDSDGNVYVTGYFYGATITFGSYTLNNFNINNSDFFIVKYDPLGTVLWARSAGAGDDDGGYSVTVDASDNVYITGYFQSPFIMFDAYILYNLGSYDMFIAKYDSSGTILWAQGAGENGDDYGRSVIVDAFNNVYVAGSFQSLYLNFNNTTLTNADVNAITRDMYIVKYDSAGTFLWAISAGDIGEEYARALAVDPSGNIYLAGNFDSPALTIGSYSLPNAGLYDMYVCKVNPGGNFLWAGSAGGTGIDYGNSVAADIFGNIYISGGFASPVINFGTAGLTNSGNFNMYVVKYNSSGNYMWSRKSGGSGSDDGYDVTTDHAGNVLIAGYFTSPSLIFGTSTINNSGFTDVYVVKYDPAGTELWAKSAGDSLDDIGVCIATRGNDVYVAGYFRSQTINFASTLNNTGGDDIFLAKIGDSGVGINDEVSAAEFLIYPNPIENEATIEFANIQLNTEIKITDTVGKVISENNFSGKNFTYDFGNLKSGIYFIHVTEGNNQSVIRKINIL